MRDTVVGTDGEVWWDVGKFTKSLRRAPMASLFDTMGGFAAGDAPKRRLVAITGRRVTGMRLVPTQGPHRAAAWLAGALFCVALLASGCSDNGEGLPTRTIMWNSTSAEGPATVFVVRDFTDLNAVRERVPDRAGSFDWPAMDFAHSVLIVYVDGASEAELQREGMYIDDVRVIDGELVLTIDPGDDLVEDDSDIQWSDVQTIVVRASDLPLGRKVRVITPDGQTLALR